jgi:hypothetical protein
VIHLEEALHLCWLVLKIDIVLHYLTLQFELIRVGNDPETLPSDGVPHWDDVLDTFFLNYFVSDVRGTTTCSCIRVIG